MPKLEAKQVQKELDEGWLWPVYWIYGPEGMKARELLKPRLLELRRRRKAGVM